MSSTGVSPWSFIKNRIRTVVFQEESFSAHHTDKLHRDAGLIFQEDLTFVQNVKSSPLMSTVSSMVVFDLGNMTYWSRLQPRGIPSKSFYCLCTHAVSEGMASP